MLTLSIADFSPAAIAASGQCFRMTEQANGWVLIAKDRYLSIRPGGEANTFTFSCTQAEFETLWKPYLDLDTDYAAFRARCLKRDAYLRAACEYGAGLRILRQDPWETLICFIISQRKNIPAIRQAVEALCRAYGARCTAGKTVYHAFPTPAALAAAAPEGLAACGLGYRAKYVYDAACRVRDGRLDLNALASLPTDSRRDALMGVYGVGIKVAQCVALFGYHRLEALPVDVWMDRILQDHYRGRFPASYAPCAGVLQQYLFYYARSQAHSQAQ